MTKKYISADFYFSAYLIAKGFELHDHYREQGLTTFVFGDNQKLQNEVKNYFSFKTAIEPIMFGNAIRSLKTMIHNNRLSTSNSKSNNNNEELTTIIN